METKATVLSAMAALAVSAKQATASHAPPPTARKTHAARIPATRPRRPRSLPALAAFAVIALAAAARPAAAAATAESEPAFVFLDKGAFSFWHTATNNVLSLPVDFPDGASGATLTVTGSGYSRQYEVAACEVFTVTLPEATSPESEDVYDLALDFGEGTVRTAKLGLLKGSFGSAGEAGTRLLSPSSAASWGRMDRRAVIPVPAGTDSLSVNGVAADTGLDGEAGWFALALLGGETASLSLVGADEEALTASLFRPNESTVIYVR